MAIIALAATLITSPVTAADIGTGGDQDAEVKAAFLYNFAKFAEWPALPAGVPIAACIVGDDEIAAALVETVRGKSINGHGVEVHRPQDTAAMRACHMLFVAADDTLRLADGLARVKKLPVLTVGDDKGFAQADGIIEFYIEGGRMRFAINVAAAERSGVRLSSRLLGLATIVGNNQ